MKCLSAVLVALLSLGVVPSAFASDEKPRRKSIADVAPVLLAATEQSRPNAKGTGDDNPYFWPGVLLMSGGGLVALYGMMHDTGVSCSTSSARSSATSLSCGTTKSKATIFTGIGMLGAGAFIFYKGKNQPAVVFGPRLVGVRQQFVW